MANHVLDVQHLSVFFQNGHHPISILDDVSLQIRAGETVALLGESGCGKTMLATTIMQLLPETIHVTANSQIFFHETDLLGLSEIQLRKIRGKRIAQIFQEPMTSLNPVLTIGDQINEGLALHHPELNRQARHEKVLALLDEVGIPDPTRCVEQYPFQLSGGMKQRVMIAMALSGNPELLIADEPTTALDVTIQLQILQLLKKIQEKNNMSILFITHDLGVVSQIADRLYVMYGGKILETASVVDFFKHPTDPYSQRLLAAVPQWEQRDASLSNVLEKSAPLLKVDHFKIYYPIQKGLLKKTVGYVKAVDDVSFEIAPGRTLALVGESGSGKTTLGKGILQLIPTTDGLLSFEGEPIHFSNQRSFKNLREKIQFIFQDPFSSLNPRQLIGDAIAEGLQGKKKNMTGYIQQLLSQVELPKNSIHRYPHEFSGGQRQRICIARALAMNPRLIVCDEPTSALDVLVQAQILKLLRQLQEELGLSYLFITHNFGVVSYLAHEVAVMYQGKIVEHGPAERVLFHPSHSYTRTLLEAVPSIM